MLFHKSKANGENSIIGNVPLCRSGVWRFEPAFSRIIPSYTYWTYRHSNGLSLTMKIVLIVKANRTLTLDLVFNASPVRKYYHLILLLLVPLGYGYIYSMSSIIVLWVLTRCSLYTYAIWSYYYVS